MIIELDWQTLRGKLDHGLPIHSYHMSRDWIQFDPMKVEVFRCESWRCWWSEVPTQVDSWEWSFLESRQLCRSNDQYNNRHRGVVLHGKSNLENALSTSRVYDDIIVFFNDVIMRSCHLCMHMPEKWPTQLQPRAIDLMQLTSLPPIIFPYSQ